jgi:hypothetical protein
VEPVGRATSFPSISYPSFHKKCFAVHVAGSGGSLGVNSAGRAKTVREPNSRDTFGRVRDYDCDLNGLGCNPAAVSCPFSGVVAHANSQGMRLSPRPGSLSSLAEHRSTRGEIDGLEQSVHVTEPAPRSPGGAPWYDTRYRIRERRVFKT